MKKAVFYTLYGNPKYTELLKLSLASLNKFKTDEEIFLFTNLEVAGLGNLCNIVREEFPVGFAAPMAYRYEIFGKLAASFDKILHLDTDTICINTLKGLWDSFVPGKVCVASESAIDRTIPGRIVFTYDKGLHPKKHYITEGYWAGPLLRPAEIKAYQNIPSICAGVFGGYADISDLLSSAYRHICEIEQSGFRGICGDQHAFCHFLIKTEAYNLCLQKHVDHNAADILAKNELKASMQNGLSILHFAGGVEPTEIKLEAMRYALSQL